MFGELFLNYIRDNRIVIYGTGYNGIYTLQYLKANCIDIEGFADIKAEIEAYSEYGYPCKRISDYKDKDELMIIVTPYVDNIVICKSIEALGFKKVVPWKDMESLFALCRMRNMDKNLRSVLNTNSLLKNTYIGNRCFIVGTGPSILKQNLSLLKDEYVFTVNTGYKIKQFSCLKSNFHVFVDSMYFSQVNDCDDFAKELTDKLCNCERCFFPYTKSRKFIEKYGLKQKLNISYIEEDLFEDWTDEDINFEQITPLTGTVVVTAVMLAIYMGFSEIYLLGCDCTDIFTSIGAKTKNNLMTTYSWDNEEKQQKRLEQTLGCRPLEQIYRMQYLKFKNFRKINSICKDKGIKLYDCTDEGLLDCVEKLNYTAVI